MAEKTCYTDPQKLVKEENVWFNPTFVDSAPCSDDNTYLQNTAANARLEFCLK